MTDIKNTFLNALLADATYFHGLLPGRQGDALAGDLSTRMTSDLAKFIAKKFSVVTQIERGLQQGQVSQITYTIQHGKTLKN